MCVVQCSTTRSRFSHAPPLSPSVEADLAACFLAAILAALLFAFVVLPARDSLAVSCCAALAAV